LIHSFDFTIFVKITYFIANFSDKLYITTLSAEKQGVFCEFLFRRKTGKAVLEILIRRFRRLTQIFSFILGNLCNQSKEEWDLAHLQLTLKTKKALRLEDSFL